MIPWSSADTAYFRLKKIVPRDRAACGDGAWVKMPRAIALGLAGAFPTPYLFKERDYYRWVARK